MYVVSVNKFSVMCNWPVVGVQLEHNGCKDIVLKRAVTLVSPRTGIIAHVIAILYHLSAATWNPTYTYWPLQRNVVLKWFYGPLLQQGMVLTWFRLASEPSKHLCRRYMRSIECPSR